MKLTKHGHRRISERHGKRGDKAREFAKRVFLNGKPREQLVGKLRKWVDHKYFMHNKTAKLIVHGGYLYVYGLESEFQPELVTTYRIPGRILQDKSNFRHRFKKLTREVVLQAPPK